MDKIIIEGGHKLHGTVKVSGAKNAALPILTASILTRETCTFSNMPDLADINTMVKLIAQFGIKAEPGKKKVKLTAQKITSTEAPYDLVRTMRASCLVLGPMLARMGVARVSLPGGCAIGARPIDRHLKALEEMGATIKLEGGYVEATCKKLKGARIYFDDITVTGTENIMMAATLAQGTTILENAAREPEVVDLANVLNAMGARVMGAGTDTITIEGVDELTGCDYAVMPDRIEAGTFLIGCILAGGEISVQDAVPEHLGSLLSRLSECGALYEIEKTTIHIKAPKEILPVNLNTQPYPGFATDFQAQFMAMMTRSNGVSLITENIFENRFMHVPELNRMGADIKLEGNTAIIKGVPYLTGAPVMATDLRASACLVVAGLAAQGITEIHRVYHLDRGYEHMERKFRKLGARVKRGKVKY
ncbi:UDP-N-acetylglucosamine 1-carboxyvinyltransferase [bacterium]|nr:UDP-N-acetylglucosamine 1-carboxyvinyltransferase [bacterium]